MCHVHLTNRVGGNWWRYLIPSEDRSGVTAPSERWLRRAGRPRRHLHIIRYSRRLSPRRRIVPHSGRKIPFHSVSRFSGIVMECCLIEIRHSNNGIAWLTYLGLLLTYIQFVHDRYTKYAYEVPILNTMTI